MKSSLKSYMILYVVRQAFLERTFFCVCMFRLKSEHCLGPSRWMALWLSDLMMFPQTFGRATCGTKPFKQFPLLYKPQVVVSFYQGGGVLGPSVWDSQKTSHCRSPHRPPLLYLGGDEDDSRPGPRGRGEHNHEEGE